MYCSIKQQILGDAMPVGILNKGYILLYVMCVFLKK